MQFNVATEISQRPELGSAVEDASRILGEILERSVLNRATADWTLSKDPDGRDLVRLLVSDWTGTVGYVFAPKELENRALMRFRLHRLWGDLLQVSSHVLFDGVLGETQAQGGH